MDGLIKGQLRGNRNRLVDTSQELWGGQKSLGLLLVFDNKFASSQTSRAIPTSLNSQACIGQLQSWKVQSIIKESNIMFHLLSVPSFNFIKDSNDLMSHSWQGRSSH